MTEIEKMNLLIEKNYKYNQETGEVISKFGKIIKSKDSYGYIKINIRLNKKIVEVKAHRFAWFYVYGKLPTPVIDHINRDKTDNRLCNLRELSIQQNTYNREVKGYTKVRNLYQAQIYKDRKNYFLGLYNTEDEAKEAYLSAKKQLHTIC
jgi:hypothetical protein